MRSEQWQTLKKCAQMQAPEDTPVALIVDSPWIPGHLEISTLDYFTFPEIWLKANLEIARQFPQVIFLPGFWVEMGMGAEPSGFGCKVRFFDDKTPNVYPLIDSLDEVERIAPSNPLTDGLMPFILNLYRKLEPKINAAGHQIKVVAARGPLATASHLVGVTNLLLGVKLDPANTHRLLELTTKTTVDWLEAQANALQNVEGVMVLDDIVGFLGPEDFLEFAHPYLSEVFGAFPEALKIFHNDMDTPVSYPYLHEWPVDIFNFTHLIDVSEARRHVGERVCLMGNVPPLEVLAEGSPKLVLERARQCLQSHAGKAGVILSAGGGISPGTPGENIRALIQAAQET